MPSLPLRPRRLRRTDAIRRLVREHGVAPARVLLEMTPGDPMLQAPLLSAFGGIWLALPVELNSSEKPVQAARQALTDGVLAVDLRGQDDAPVDAARVAHDAGADLVAIDGAHVEAVRGALERAGSVHALIAACASFPLDAAGEKATGLINGDAWVRAGADLVLLEPALPNLDRIRAASEALAVPVIARCTPQEAAMYRAAFERGWLDAEKVPLEVLVSLFRAGARVAVAPSAWAAGIAGTHA